MVAGSQRGAANFGGAKRNVLHLTLLVSMYRSTNFRQSSRKPGRSKAMRDCPNG